jgi:putative nucleotidyltransferase with HDIG domain
MKISTLRFKISSFIAILLIITASLFTILTIQIMDRHMQNEVIKRAEALGKSMAALAPYSILSNDLLGIDNIGWKVKEANNDIEYAAVADMHGKILTHTDLSKIGTILHTASLPPLKKTPEGTSIYDMTSISNSFEIRSPMTFNNKQIGTVIIGINQSALAEARSQMLKRIFSGLGIVMFLGIGCIVVLSSLITKPIKELSRGVDELKQGRRSKLRIYSHDELGKLTASFNQMTELTTRQQIRLSTYAGELEEAYVSTVRVLTAAIDARDPYTLGHSTRVSKLAVKTGQTLGLPPEELEDLEISSLFHDVGKLKTPDYVLLKDGPLGPEEQREISSHCEQGASILSRASSLQKYIPAIRHHHEWFDGKGYPDGLRGNDIPLHAAIIAVADAYDAMTSVRPYKLSRSHEDALQELQRFSGTQFNPVIVEAFLAAMNFDSVDSIIADRLFQREG